jgi:hypothetical protein
MFWFFFYTPFGLVLQTYIALKIQPAYLRFYSSRVAAARGTYCGQFSSLQLYDLAWNDLRAAHDAASAAIAQEPTAFDFDTRGCVELNTLSYSNAVADFEQALELWNQKPVGENLDPARASAYLKMAKACAEAKQKYFVPWQKGTAGVPSPTESKPPPSDK